MSAESEPVPASSRELWRYYTDLFRGSTRTLAWAIAAAIGQSLMLLPVALLVGWLFDQAIPKGDIAGLVGVSAIIFLLYLGNTLLYLWMRWQAVRLTKDVIARLRVGLSDRFYELSQAFYSQSDLSALHSTAVIDSERIDAMTYETVTQLIPCLLVGGGLAVVLFILYPALFAVMIVATPTLWFMRRFLGKRLARAVMDYRHDFEVFSGGLLFTLQKMTFTRAHGAEADERAKRSAQIEALRATSVQFVWLQAAYGMAQTVVFLATTIIILIIGGAAVAAKTLTLGSLIGFYVGYTLFATCMRVVSLSIPTVIAGRQSLEAIYRLMCVTDEPPYRGTRQIDFGGDIDVRNVAFSYRAEQLLLRDVTLHLKPGEKVLLTGDNGAGKTTLLSLLLGFYRPQRGTILFDGQPIDDLDLPHLRRQMGVVMQELFLLSGSVRDNIAYGCPDADDGAIAEAARLAQADDFIRALPEGYDSAVGDEGARLSGGQRQRIALARALVRRPALLMLDEPTNHLDRDAAAALIELLRGLSGTTLLIVSHDRGLLDAVDRAYQLADGYLTEIALAPSAEQQAAAATK